MIRRFLRPPSRSSMVRDLRGLALVGHVAKESHLRIAHVYTATFTQPRPGKTPSSEAAQRHSTADSETSRTIRYCMV